MKRSEVNAIIANAEVFFEKMNFKLPPWAYRTPAEWRGRTERAGEIFENMLGWDLTDFGLGDFRNRGLLLFTIRNGNPDKSGKNYAEKIMVVEEEQETPFHFHWSKMEDIINRGGGNLVLELYRSTAGGGLSDKAVTVKVDGIEREVPAGGKVTLIPGESISLEQGVYHRFYGEKGRGTVLTGEVSMVNDDNADNRFYEPLGRFPTIDEDTTPRRLLVSDYQRFLKGEL